ncbi:MAG: restriction endonuclease subunit S [Acidovorax temperans]|uniref:restriction endonuclease subunit S n=1 Tax=Acidovorax temperans TaxID=80878 RepID=UPI00391995FF
MGIFDGPHATPKKTLSGPVFLGISSLNNGQLDLSNTEHLSEEDFAKWTRRVTPEAGDLVFSYETRLGQIAVIPPGLRCCLGRRMALMRVDPTKALSDYLLYAYLSPDFQEVIRQRTIHGSTVDRIPLVQFGSFPVAIPPLAIQQEIVAVLRALDDRITLLRETNATLEAIAQALFKSWFVDFDPVRAKMEGRAPEGMDEATAALFPNALEESELGDLPKGWRVGALKDCCTNVQSGGTPKRTVPEYWNGGISWLTSGEVRSPIVFDTREKITEEGLAGSSAKLWPVGTTVVAMYGATAGEVCVIASPMTANQACCGLIPKGDFRTFLFFCTRRERETLASKSSGSAQQNLNKGLVETHPIILPSTDVVAAFDTTVGSLLDSWIANDQQAQTLSTLRDTLLPRLISGQLRLPEALAEMPMEAV